MPNITWLEPQVVVDLLALNLFAADNALRLPGPPQVAVVSPWLSDVELALQPGPWQRLLSVGRGAADVRLVSCLRAFLRVGWTVEVAVLAYGTSPSGLTKQPGTPPSEAALLSSLKGEGASVHSVVDLHAKGIVTPLGVLTGSTNITRGGLYVQSQNANYFPHDHADYAANRLQLLNCFRLGGKPWSPE